MNVFTIKEVSEIIKTSEEMVRQHVRAKRIKAVKFGHKWMVTEQEINKIISEGF